MALSIVSRSAWGATPWRSGVNRVAMSEKVDFLVHYHGGKPAANRGVMVPRNVEKIHLDNGWSGVGYNFLVDLDGTIYEGRGWDGVGSQCPGHNRSGIGVYVAVGGDQRPTDAALRSVRALYDEGCRRSGNRLSKMGHRDGTATTCPGTVLYAWVKAGLPYPGTSAAPSTEEDDMPTVSDVWTTDLTKTGRIGGNDVNESPLEILTRVARNVEYVAGLVKASGNTDAIAAAVVKAMPAGSTVDEATLARAFVSALTDLAAKEA
jgi:hypothetical protein